MKVIKQVTLFFLIGTFSIQAQKAKVRKADKKFDNLAYVDALQIYEEVAKNGYVNEDIYRRLGDANYFNAKYEKAVYWFHKLFELNPNQSPEYNFRYGQSLKSTKKYKEADAVLGNYYKAQGIQYTSAKDYLDIIEKHSNRFVIDTTGLNTKQSDYPAFMKGEELYVVSGKSGEKETPWTGEPTSDIFIESNGELKNLEGEINTNYNEGSLAITKDGKTMFFTRNNFDGKRTRKDDNKVIRLKLYRAENVEGNWTNIKELPFNSDEYSVGHPALSKDGKKLYFVSDMPNNGNKGGTDIFEVELFDDGGYGAIFNMAGFNTIGNDLFPFVDSNGTFYFASNGHAENLGGLDLYMSELNENGVYGKVNNMGKPVNSIVDDFAFVFNSELKSGYFASNRNLEQSDDIYKIIENEDYKAPCLVSIKGRVKDKQTGDPLSNAMVTLLDENNTLIERVVTNDDAFYAFKEVDCNVAKFVRAEKIKYQANEVIVDKNNFSDSYNILLDKRTIEVTQGSDLGKFLNPIYFDLDKWDIRPDAEVELQKIIAILRKNTSMKIDIRSHTDSRASNLYNLNLSEKRAQSTINYIVLEGGIDKSRLTGRGYGESQLINNCFNNVTCSKEEHQQNRRSEFIILKI